MNKKKSVNKFRESFSFFVPKRAASKKHVSRRVSMAAVIPTYRPSLETLRLTKSLIKWYPGLEIYVVNDCTPIKYSWYVNRLTELSQQNKKLHILSTPVNKKKAGAINFALKYLKSKKKNPQVIFTFDDDVRIDRKTLYQMAKSLLSDSRCGAVCSLSHVINKNKNILTRLQGLEYHGFNIVKDADTGFLKGPLVMQGMLTAFRYKAIKSVKGFSEGHLIEDYEITVRLKLKGWSVKLSRNANAWTKVPENFQSLWRQRVRWSYGGLHVVTKYRPFWDTIFQDLVGHLMFILLFTFVILSLFFGRSGNLTPYVVWLLLIIAIGQFLLAFLFQISILIRYKEADRLDWIIRLSFLPEFLYSNVLTILLLGSYIFFMYNKVSNLLARRFSKFSSVDRLVQRFFARLGYSQTWGTRVN